MAYCQGCGHYVGDYSSYRHGAPGKGELVLCYQCKRWAERHPGRSKFPQRQFLPPTDIQRIRRHGAMYLIASGALLALGAFFIVNNRQFPIGILLALGAVSLFSMGLGMRRYSSRWASRSAPKK